jgi:homogentisate 1,2-dioxygenase
MSAFDNLKYATGYGSYVSTEALEGALPIMQNTPQQCPYGLYAELLTGTAFTAPRHKNLRTWFYRIRPSVLHEKIKPDTTQTISEELDGLVVDPNQFRWSPYPLPSESEKVDFIDGLKLVCAAGDATAKEGLSIYVYTANVSMENKAFYNADGDFLIVPQLGTLFIKTEMGNLKVEPCEIVVIPRGVKFQILVDGPVRGYIAEILKGHLELPGLGPIGSSGLANQRDFEFPVAAFEDVDIKYLMTCKFVNKMYYAEMDHSPFDVVAWHGNYSPFKYDLRRFNTVNTVSYDHLDPSIFTVLTCQSDDPGTAILDFVIFPPRWMVATNTFRPPYYHRNCMSEFMGMIYGKYDAKVAVEGDKEGFVPGGCSLHSCMTPHGPDASTFLAASSAKLEPTYFGEGLAFMFESTLMLKVTPSALASDALQSNYLKCWQRLPKLFDGTVKPNVDWEKLKNDK